MDGAGRYAEATCFLLGPDAADAASKVQWLERPWLLAAASDRDMRSRMQLTAAVLALMLQRVQALQVCVVRAPSTM